MIRADEDALICDFAETYHIYDFRALPVSYAATLACGLGEKSRIFKKMTGNKLDVSDMLLAAAVDRLSLLWWAKTRDGQKNTNKPKSMVELLQNADKNSESEIVGFNSGEDFKKTWEKLSGRG
jgi:hypothetical protein